MLFAAILTPLYIYFRLMKVIQLIKSLRRKIGMIYNCTTLSSVYLKSKEKLSCPCKVRSSISWSWMRIMLCWPVKVVFVIKRTDLLLIFIQKAFLLLFLFIRKHDAFIRHPREFISQCTSLQRHSIVKYQAKWQSWNIVLVVVFFLALTVKWMHSSCHIIGMSMQKC